MNTKTTQISLASALLIGVISTSLMSNDDTGALGPADSIVLAGDDGDVTITNSEGRISWGEKKTSTVWSIGFMETGKALSQLLKADHFKETREDLNSELKAEMAIARAALEEVVEEAKGLEKEDPNAVEIRQRWQQLYDEFQYMQKIGADARGALLAKQMQESYNEILEAVNVVSERMNYSQDIYPYRIKETNPSLWLDQNLLRKLSDR